MQTIENKQESEYKPTVVVVDDDPDILEWCRLVLEPAGFRTERFQLPRTALAHIRTHPPDLVITDLMMDALDAGFSFARCIRQDPELRHIPVILMTAAASRHGFDFTPQSEADLAAMQVDAFFAKPADARALVAKVRLLAGHGRG